MNATDRERILAAADEAEYVIVAASNGLDMSEGLDIFRPNAHFLQAYGDFAQAYGVRSVLHGLAARWPSEEARWAFLARVAMTEWLGYEPSAIMRRLQVLVGDKNAYVITCNFDGRFARAGFPEERVLETEGSLRHLVCADGCDDELIPAEETYRRLAAATQGLRVPAGLVPRCPRCGAPLVPNIREDRAQRPDAVYAQGGTPYLLSERPARPLEEEIVRFAQMVRGADHIIIGGASGLSAAGGGDFYYEDNASFRRYFGKFAEKYHLHGAFSGMSRQWETPNERWGYVATFLHTTQTAPARKPYLDLAAIIGDKDYFILTTNQDTQAVKVFPEDRVA